MSEEKKDEEILEEEISGDDVQEIVSKLKKLKEQLKQCQSEKQEYLTGWQRAQADFINYRRRQEEQMGNWLKMSEEKIIRDVLPVLDTFDHAARQKSEVKPEIFESIKKQFLQIFKKYGLEEIKSVGEKFNPEQHEAIEQVRSGEPEGMVVEEVQKGYLLNGKILRPAKVKVTKNIK